jgi:hypothetical protein
MTDQSKPKFEQLDRKEAEELTSEEAEKAQGGRKHHHAGLLSHACATGQHYKRAVLSVR